jgi:hypothetical protein
VSKYNYGCAWAHCVCMPVTNIFVLSNLPWHSSVASDSLYVPPSAEKSYQRNTFHISRKVFHAPVHIVLFVCLFLVQVLASPKRCLKNKR